MYMKASEVAAELRRVADSLDTNPEILITPYFSIQVEDDDKQKFKELARTMPRPMKKGVDFPGASYASFKLEHSFWCIKIPQSKICVIKEPARPAVYDCPPLFSPKEEAELEVDNANA